MTYLLGQAGPAVVYLAANSSSYSRPLHQSLAFQSIDTALLHDTQLRRLSPRNRNQGVQHLPDSHTSMGHLEAAMIIDTNQGLRAVSAKPLVNLAEARGFEPRMGVNPNRISSAAP
jgi:hypothetical protein